MADLNALLVFAKVIEAESFSKAARKLEMPVSTVSRRIADLEAQLGVQLIERSTRSLRLTDIGTEILAHALRTTEVSESVDDIVKNHRTAVSGLLRIAAPPSLSESLIGPAVVAFAREYPDVRVQILVTERHVDFIAEGVELAVDIGSLFDPALEERRILRYRHRLVTSPAYLATCPPLESPSDLLPLELLTFSYWTHERTWDFEHILTSERRSLRFRPRLSMNDYLGLAYAIVAGRGVGELPPIVAPKLLRDGRLIEILPQWQFPEYYLSLVHPRNRYVARPVRAFVEFASDFFAQTFPDLAVTPPR